MSEVDGVTGPVSEQNRVHIFDTTLRDGEQSPGISLNTQEKVEIAQQLARLGVDVIEAGFPITSPGDFEAVEAIGKPASIMSTPRSRRARAISSFSVWFMEQPGDCSPSRRVVSKMWTRFSSATGAPVPPT